MAAEASTTRRALIAGAAIAPATAVAVSALPTATQAHAGSDWQKLARFLEAASPGGGMAAVHAHGAGMDLNDLSLISMETWGDPHEPTFWPLLMFRHGKGFRTFRPCGEDK